MFYTLEKYEEAITDCQRAIELDPNFVKAYYRQGLAHFEKIQTEGSADKAIELFDKAVQLDGGESEEMRTQLEFA